MPLSKKSIDDLYIERQYPCPYYPQGMIFKRDEDRQWFHRDMLQDRVNSERKKQWAVKLRFMRPDNKLSVLA